MVVLAHELGHHIRRHITKLAFIGLGTPFVLFFAAHRTMVGFPGFPEEVEASLAVFPIFMVVTGGLSVPIRILTNAYSRTKEREADLVALQLTGDSRAFIAVMAGLANTNLAEAYPRRYKVFLFYSHPPIGERIEKAGAEGR